MSKKPMSATTKGMLLDADVMSSRGLTEVAKPRRCPTCSAWCWAGLADIGPYGGVFVSWPATTAFGEMLALSARMATYLLDGRQLERRTHVGIARYSADEYRVHIQHFCNGPPIPIHPGWKKKPPTSAIEYPKDIPF